MWVHFCTLNGTKFYVVNFRYRQSNRCLKHYCLATFAKMKAGRSANRNDVASSLYSQALAGYCRIANSQLPKWSHVSFRQINRVPNASCCSVGNRYLWLGVGYFGRLCLW